MKRTFSRLASALVFAAALVVPSAVLAEELPVPAGARCSASQPAADPAALPLEGVLDTARPATTCTASKLCYFDRFYYYEISCTGQEWCYESFCWIWCDGQMYGCTNCIEP